MRIICVDDEDLVLRLTGSLCRDIAPADCEVEEFLFVQDALDWFREGISDDFTARSG